MGRKRESDNTIARGFYRHMHINSTLCTCGHPRWRHLGINEPACTFLGTCTCPKFKAIHMKETA